MTSVRLRFANRTYAGSQRVPANPELWKLDNYRQFLLARREALAQCMNEFIRSKAGL